MNLILCSTPLQLKIAIRIIEEKKLEKVIVLFTGIMPNKRNSFYLNKIDQLADHLYLYDKDKVLKRSRSFYLNRKAKKLVRELRLNSVSNIYLANLNQRFYHHLLSVINFQNLYTFDDGTENVNQQSHFYRYKRYSKFRKFVQRAFGRNYWMEDILRRTQCHYTIYKDIANVVANSEFIPLYKEENRAGLNNRIEQKEISILVGSVYRDMVKERKEADCLIEEVDRYLLENRVDLYIPHPRDEENYFQNCHTIIPEQMVEEVVINYLKEGYAISLYGFGGSGQLNLDDVDNVKNYLFMSGLLSEKTLHCYQLFNDKSEIVVIDNDQYPLK